MKRYFYVVKFWFLRKTSMKIKEVESLYET